MTVIIIILAYVVNVFLNRWLNKIANKLSGDSCIIAPASWFCPLFPTILLIIVIGGCLFTTKLEERSNWFTGKYWKKDE